MRLTSIIKVAAVAMPLFLCSCGSKKKAVVDNQPQTVTPTQENEFIQKVNSNVQKAKFITSKVKFSVEYGSQNISLTGNLRMKRDDVIRLQLMAFGFVEAARLEFTKDYVLIMDRINKQYLKAPYAHIDFLRNSGLNFNSLQALFWNELFQPNRTNLTAEDMQKYNVNTDKNDVIVSFEDEKLDYSWLTSKKTGAIQMANIVYKDRLNGNTQLNWDYKNFKLFEATNKLFPNDMTVQLTTPKKSIKLDIKLSYIKQETDWETRTEVSSKYSEVKIDEILQRFMAL